MSQRNSGEYPDDTQHADTEACQQHGDEGIAAAAAGTG